MKVRLATGVLVTLAAAAAVAYAGRPLVLRKWREQPQACPAEFVLAAQQPARADQADPTVPAADHAAVVKASKAFGAAFNKGEAKAIAALWTEKGEHNNANDEVTRGRAALEKVFAAAFKVHPKATVELQVESIRFPSPDMAIEEGLLRKTLTERSLPASSRYRIVRVRDGGKWPIALSREWGEHSDRIEDLQWLIGEWKATTPGVEVTLKFTRDGDGPYLIGRFKRKIKDDADSGTLRIAFDPQANQIHSWHFDDDGGRGEALWFRDRNNWMLESIGVSADGLDTRSTILFGRISNTELTWRSVNGSEGDRAMPDTPVLRLKKVAAAK